MQSLPALAPGAGLQPALAAALPAAFALLAQLRQGRPISSLRTRHEAPSTPAPR